MSEMSLALVDTRSALKRNIAERQAVARNIPTLQASALALEQEKLALHDSILREEDPKRLEKLRGELKAISDRQEEEISIIASSIPTMQKLAREFQTLLESERVSELELRSKALNDFLDKHDSIFRELETLKNAVSAVESGRTGVCDPLAKEMGFADWRQVSESMSPPENYPYENLMRERIQHARGV